MSLRGTMRNIDGRMRQRRGIASAISCEGIGLHTGMNVRLRFLPSEPGSGILFHRTDLGAVIFARYEYVVESRLCTTICDPTQPGASVATIEHLMAALGGVGIDDVVIEIDGPEVPILDGSAAEFVFLLRCAGIVETDASMQIIEVLKTIRVVEGRASAELCPSEAGSAGLAMALSIDFPDKVIGRQELSLQLDDLTFVTELARARTFARVSDIETARAAGLARGGSLANAVVVDGGNVLNREGLRWDDEFVRHKLLDVVGDLALAGAPIHGRFVGTRTGHRLNNLLLHELFADNANYRAVSWAPVSALAAVA